MSPEIVIVELALSPIHDVEIMRYNEYCQDLFSAGEIRGIKLAGRGFTACRPDGGTYREFDT